MEQHPENMQPHLIDPNNPLNQGSDRKHDKKLIDPESMCLVEGKKSPVKYNYLETEQSHEQQREWEIFWLQFFAMFIFIYASTCKHQATGIDLQFFVGIMMTIPICAKQTGANLNPAVTLAMTFKATGVPVLYQSLLWIYVKAQLLGAALAMWVAVTINHVNPQPLSPSPAQFSVIFQVILSEAIGVFILIFMILYGTGPYSFLSSRGAKYFYIAVFVYIGRKFAGASGNQINIALTFSQALVGLINCNFAGFYYLGAWVIGDLLGVTLASFIYLKLVEPMREYLEKHQTAKVMSKLKFAHESELKGRDNIEGDQHINLGSGDYYRKLQYY